MLEIVKENIILAKNENTVLPILDNFRGVKVLVTGPTANELRYYSGGWTWSWQGDTDDKNFPMENRWKNLFCPLHIWKSTMNVV